MRNDHAKIVDVQHAIHIGVFQVERPLRFVDSIRQFQELGKHKLGDFVNTVWTVPFEDILVPLAGIAFPACADAVVPPSGDQADAVVLSAGAASDGEPAGAPEKDRPGLREESVRPAQEVMQGVCSNDGRPSGARRLSATVGHQSGPKASG